MNTLFAVLLVAAFAFGGACPDLGALRTPHVRQDLAPERLEGLWYEQAYIDFAQVGASCQTMNASYAPESGDLSVDFRVLYAGVPFTLPLLYKPVDGTDSKGLFVKRLSRPVGRILQLPTVVVDVGAEAAAPMPYNTLTLFSCATPFPGVVLRELVFVARRPEPDSAVLERMKAVARAQGLDWNDRQLKLVDRTACNGSFV